MAVTPTRYADDQDYARAFGDYDPSQSEGVLASLDAVARYIDGYCKRIFGAEETAVAKLFVPARSTSLLTVGDMSAAPTTVKIDTDQDGSFADEDEITGFEAWPLNADDGPEPRPFYQIHLPRWASVTAFTGGLYVEVTCKWGWPSGPPEAVKQASVQLAGILRMQSPRATNRYDEVGTIVGASREARGIVRDLLDQYRLERAYY